VKRIILIFVLTIIFIGNNSILAQETTINNGLSWLLSNQDPSGLWGDPTRTPFRDTCTVIDTLSYLKASNNTSYNNGIQWILNSDAVNIDYLSRRILNLPLSGNASQSDIDILISFQNKNGGWGLNYGQLSDVLDTSLALQALKSINYQDQSVISSALGYLISNQNPDGGFGFYAGDDSNVYMTAMVSYILQQFTKTTSIATAINKATAYLISRQNPDGGFGAGSSTVYETSLAYIASVGVTTDATVMGNAINYLTTTQSLNGSWNDDPYSTALAIRALANEKPNLFIAAGDIYFSNYAPTAGETITITANIKNTVYYGSWNSDTYSTRLKCLTKDLEGSI
jgi:prenyltransferase beta subunit